MSSRIEQREWLKDRRPSAIEQDRIEKAREWLSTDKGRHDLTDYIREGLLLMLMEEREAALHPKDAGKATEANARQSRKQFKELSELVLEIMDVK